MKPFVAQESDKCPPVKSVEVKEGQQEAVELDRSELKC